MARNNYNDMEDARNCRNNNQNNNQNNSQNNNQNNSQNNNQNSSRNTDLLICESAGGMTKVAVQTADNTSRPVFGTAFYILHILIIMIRTGDHI